MFFSLCLDPTRSFFQFLILWKLRTYYFTLVPFIHLHFPFTPASGHHYFKFSFLNFHVIFVFALFYWAQWPPVPSTLLRMSAFHFLWLINTPFYMHTTLSIHVFLDGWMHMLIPYIALSWIMLQWTWEHNYFLDSRNQFPLAIYLEVRQPGHMVRTGLVFWGTYVFYNGSIIAFSPAVYKGSLFSASSPVPVIFCLFHNSP